MLKYYKSLNFRANEVNDHEIQARLENSKILENANIFMTRR